ncbi:MAG TPA: efflux RND transporter permease subunit [Arenimonas sp.]|uniref:efflux RND transporter permease subunit n=1 Tax=Arenimonas sp. TaxID=1872635 RepID=UPI002CFDD78C|nr:efflux RND transporter permease subunit [Arenimonas sp.]HMB57737.1 efflux RND transporter permease subunit [Arenimonas sp.]
MNLVEFATRRRVTVFMITLTFVIFGVIALFNLKVNLLPDLSYPTLTVRTEYTGAAPSEVETLLSEPIEEAVGVVKNLRKLQSISRTGQSDVVLEFAWGTDMDQASLEVRDKLDVLRLPLEAKAPVLLRFNPSTEPVMRLVLTTPKDNAGSDQAELMRLRRYADDELKKRLEPVDGVAAVKVAGGLEDEVQVQVDADRLAQLNLPASLVIDRLKQENVNISGGRIEEGSERYLVRTVNQFSSLDQMRELLITSLNGVPVRLKDVATVVQGYKEREAVIRLAGREAVELAIYKEGDANTVAVANAVRHALATLQSHASAGLAKTAPSKPGEYLIDGIPVRTIEDQSKFIKNALSEVQFEALVGGFLSILIIFFFLRDGWSTFVIGLSLPVSIIATFFFMDRLGLSLNVMSLAGLALATGMVVDDSIVVLESIAKARERGLGILQAAVVGTREVSMAVVASTLTTVAVFFPLVFVQGVAGQLFKDQALTVSIALMISLVVSLTLIPMLSSIRDKAPLAFKKEDPHPPWQPTNKAGRVAAGAGRGVIRGFAGSAFGLSWLFIGIARGLANTVGVWLARLGEFILIPYERAAKFYHGILPKALDRPWPILACATAAFVIAMFVATTLGTDLIPQLAQDRFEMTAKLPPGTQLNETDALVRAVQLAHDGDKDIEALYGVSGTGTRLDANPTESGENVAKLSVVLGEHYSKQTEAQVTERMRKTMAQYPDVGVKFGRPQLFSFSTPLEIELRGQDLESLSRAGRKLAELMQGSAHFADVKSSVEQGFPEVQIRFDQQRAAALGLTSRQIADQVVRQVRGEVATRYSFRDRKIDVLVRGRESDRASVDDIRRIIVNPQSDRPVTLAAVADVVETTGPSEIHRADQTRVAVVSSNLRGIDLGTAVAEVRKLVKDNPLGADIHLGFGGQSEELDSSIQSLMFAFGLAIFLVYLVMASQFESLLHPFVIMFSVPLAIVGAVAALWLSNSPVSVVVFIGLILLVGIVVKNAIVLIDKVNQLREEGVAKRDAICRGAESRLRPIIMTTLTTLFGFAPLAFFGGDGAEVRAPMAITVIGGLSVSTILTLVVIPIMYNLLDRKSDAFYRERAKPIDLSAPMEGLHG